MAKGSKSNDDGESGEPFGKAYTAIVRDRSLPRNVRTLYVYFTTYCAAERVAFPGRDLIAEDVDLSVRAVNDAIRIGEAVGLWTIVKVPTGRGYCRNRYELHDADGRYVPGSGPGERGKGKPRGCTTEPQAKFASSHRQNLPPARAKSAHYQDKRSRPTEIKTTSTSSDASCVAREQVRAPKSEQKPTLYLRPDLPHLSEKEARRHLVGATLTALKAVGLTPAHDIAQRLGRALKTHHANGATNEQLGQMLTRTLADPAGNGLLDDGSQPEREAPHPAAHLDPDADDYYELIEDLVVAAVGASLRVDSERKLEGMISSGEHPIAVYNAVVKHELGDSPWD